MSKRLIRVIILTTISIILVIGIFFSLNKKNNGWKKINIGNGYYETTTIELDLDGDNAKEKVNINKSGKFIAINGIDYIVNKYYTERDSDNSTSPIASVTNSKNYNVNQYHIVDLNGDGILEIIHRTFSDMISPINSIYTIYNFKDNNLIEIGSISIIGNIPNEIYVKDNTIKFEYWPFESPQKHTEEIVYELNV